MLLADFRASGRDVANLDDAPHHLGCDDAGRVYLYDGGPFIQRWEDARHGIAPPNGPTWLLIIGNEQHEGDLAKLEEILFDWCEGEGFFEQVA